MTKIIILTLLVALALIGTGCENLEEYETEDNGMDEEHVREVRFSEVDLQGLYWRGRALYEHGDEGLPISDLSQILGLPITTKEEAVKIANEILESESHPDMEVGQGIIENLTLELLLVEHDQNQNLWLFSYWQYFTFGASMHIAVDGNTGKLLCMWKEGVREEFREVDLSEPDLSGRFWYERGGESQPISDLSQILGQPITTREEAVAIANRILESESHPDMEVGKGIIGGLILELMLVEHDPNQNIWIFQYWQYFTLGSSLSVAVDGSTGEFLRMWVW